MRINTETQRHRDTEQRTKAKSFIAKARNERKGGGEGQSIRKPGREQARRSLSWFPGFLIECLPFRVLRSFRVFAMKDFAFPSVSPCLCASVVLRERH